MNTKMIEISSSVITSNVSGFHLYEVPRIVNFTDSESTLVDARGRGGEVQGKQEVSV